MADGERPAAHCFGTLGDYQYAVILSHYHGKFLLSKRKDRHTWEMQGGHIETGESPEQTARRELYEESGAINFILTPLCDYIGEEPGKANYGSGMVFEAEILALGEIPDYEMAETALFDEFPQELTYPLITDAILKYRNGRGDPKK